MLLALPLPLSVSLEERAQLAGDAPEQAPIDIAEGVCGLVLSVEFSNHAVADEDGHELRPGARERREDGAG
jgi:hypothetical protein